MRRVKTRGAGGQGHDHFGGTERTAGEQLECPTLFRVDATLSRGNAGIRGYLHDMWWKCPVGYGGASQRGKGFGVLLGHFRRISFVYRRLSRRRH